jgi:TP901 family phage tail tape measure protein
MGELQKRMATMSQNQGGIASFGKLQAAASQTAGKLNAARGRVRELGEQMRAAANPSAQLKRQFTAANVEANKLQNKLAGQRKELGQLRTTLSAAGVDTRNFSNEQARLAQNAKLAADAAKLQAAQGRLQQAQGALDETKGKLTGAAIKSDILASAGIVMALKAPIQQAANFEQAMARVGAVTGVTGEEFDMLSAQSRQLGRDTQFTAVQSANAQEMLARAGFKTNEILGAMPGLLNMAAAEGMDLAQAADISASVLRGFGLNAETESARVSDVLAKMSAASNTSIASLGESMKMVAPVAAGLGISLEETAAMIGVMGNAGIKGTMAGNALKEALGRLSKEPKQVAKALGELGIATRDENGKLRTMPSLMKALSAKMKGMGEADQMKKLVQIFGSQAAPAMLAIMKAAIDDEQTLKKLEEAAYSSAGAAASMAARMNATAQGAMARLISANESLMIDIGNVLLPGFTAAVEGLAMFTGGVSELTQKFPIATKVLVGGVAALGAYKVAFTAGRIAWTAAKLPSQHISLLMAKMNASMVLNGQTSMWAAAKTQIMTAAQGAWNKVVGLGRGLLDVGKLAVFHAKQLAISVATKAWTAAQWLWNAAMNANPIGLIIIAVAALVAAGYWLYNNWDAVCAAVSAAWQWVWDKIKAFWNWLTGIFSWDGITAGFDTAKNLVASGWEGLKGVFSWAGEAGSAPRTPLWTFPTRLSPSFRSCRPGNGADRRGSSERQARGSAAVL